MNAGNDWQDWIAKFWSFLGGVFARSFIELPDHQPETVMEESPNGQISRLNRKRAWQRKGSFLSAT